MMKRRKNVIRSYNMAAVVRISGPNLFVNWSMKISLIQKRKAVPANNQSKWKPPELMSFKSFYIIR